NITFNGFRAAGVTLQSIGPATNLPQGRQVRVAQFADSLSWTRSRHTMQFGIDYRNLDNSVPFLPNLNGAFRFSSAARIVANAPSFVTIVAGKPTITYKENDQFYFAQDEDRKSTRLNSSHVAISYAVFCLKKKNNTT